jgi:hypothetical protein
LRHLRYNNYGNYYSETIEELNKQVSEFNTMRSNWMSSKAITLRLHNDGTITFTSYDGREYDAYWNDDEQKWKYIKNGKSFAIFEKEE